MSKNYPLFKIYRYSGMANLEKSSTRKKFFEFESLPEAMARVKILQQEKPFKQIVLVKQENPLSSEIICIFKPDED